MNRAQATTVCFASIAQVMFALCAAMGARALPAAGAQAMRPAPHDAVISGDVDTYIAEEMREQKIPGLSLAVVLDGRVIKAQGYGYADLEFRAPVSPETVFQSGSVGKQFTATAVMMLVEEGKIGLEDSITKYFPQAPASWSSITIRDLLSHQSGIKNYTDGKDVNFRKDYTEDELLGIAESLSLDFPPGSDWTYSNTGYLVLGVLIHKVTGEFYGDFLHERIFAPLGMKTRVISESDVIPNRASGYQLVNHQWKNQDWVSPTLNTTADGSLYFTTLDLAKWDAALYTTKLLKPSSLDQMWTVQKLQSGPSEGRPNKGHYGFGWFIDEINGHRLIEHGGAWQGFTDSICRYVDDRLTVIVLTNLDSDHSNPDKVAHEVAGLYIPALKPPPPPKAIRDTEPQVSEELRRVVAQLTAGKVDLDMLSAEQQKKLDADTQHELQGLLADQGALEKLELLTRKEENGERVYTYRARFEYGVLALSMRLASNGKISDLGFKRE